jgi:hypothetical protein
LRRRIDFVLYKEAENRCVVPGVAVGRAPAGSLKNPLAFMQRSLPIAVGILRACEDVGWPSGSTAFAKSASAKNIDCGKFRQSDVAFQEERVSFHTLSGTSS